MEVPITISSYNHQTNSNMATNSTTKSSPWGKPAQLSTPVPSCLQDVMNEQLSEEFIEQEQKNIEKDFKR